MVKMDCESLSRVTDMYALLSVAILGKSHPDDPPSTVRTFAIETTDEGRTPLDAFAATLPCV